MHQTLVNAKCTYDLKSLNLFALGEGMFSLSDRQAVCTLIRLRRISGAEVIKLFFMLNSTVHEIFPAHNC